MKRLVILLVMGLLLSLAGCSSMDSRRQSSAPRGPSIGVAPTRQLIFGWGVDKSIEDETAIWERQRRNW